MSLQPNTNFITDQILISAAKLNAGILHGLKHPIDYDPTSNPVSIERKHFDELINDHYVVGEKSDGIRFSLMLFEYPSNNQIKQTAIMVDRNFRLFEISTIAEESYYKGTLMSGELIWEKFNNTKRQVFLIYDMVALMGKFLEKSLNLMERFELLCKAIKIDKDVINDPGSWLEKAVEYATKDKKIVCAGNSWCLTFRPKPYFAKKNLPSLWRTLNLNKTRKFDGLMFTNVNTSHTFKWKWHHTIDLKAFFCQDKNLNSFVRLAMQDGSKEIFLDETTISLAEKNYIFKLKNPQVVFQWRNKFPEKECPNIVIECTFSLLDHDNDKKLIELQVEKIRADKKQANNRFTIERTLINFIENITIDELIQLVTK